MTDFLRLLSGKLTPVTSLAVELAASMDECPATKQVSPTTGTRDRGFITIDDAIRIFKVPAYYFWNASVRANYGIPHYKFGHLIRFKPGELCQWLLQRDEKADAKNEAPSDSPRPLPITNGAVPAPRKMLWHEALRHLRKGTVSIP